MIAPELPLAEAHTIAPYRAQYLESLPEAQEAFLEMLMLGAQHHLIVWKGEHAGYISLHEKKTALEFFLLPNAISFAQDLFPLILDKLHIERAWIKSFDAMFLSCALDCQTSLATKGLLVREYLPRALPQIERITYTRRKAKPEDLEAVIAVDQPVFTNPLRLKAAIAAGNIHLFEHGSRLVGFCLVRVIVPGKPHVDVGIAVDTPFRNKGYAPYMLRDVVEFCLAEGYEPVTGCEQENLPSFRIGRRIGFVARYRLVEAHFAAGLAPLE